jgi:hypothetical protein
MPRPERRPPEPLLQCPSRTAGTTPTNRNHHFHATPVSLSVLSHQAAIPHVGERSVRDVSQNHTFRVARLDPRVLCSPIS